MNNNLTVWLKYSGGAADARLALPVRVLDDEGELLDQGVASTTEPARFSLAAESRTLFVRLELPSGKTRTQRANFLETSSVEVTFSDADLAPDDWSAWAVPRLYGPTALAGSNIRSEQTIARYNGVWLKLWQFRGGQWSELRIDPSAQHSNDGAKQLDMQLEPQPYLLQIGGDLVPWQFVSLPCAGACRVLLTPRDEEDLRAEPLKIVVTGFSSDAEMLLEFLARDALQSASALAHFEPLVSRLLTETPEESVAALAWGYFQLRTDGWRSVPLRWFENVSRRFAWIPDAAAIHCVAAIRGGIHDTAEEASVRNLLVECLERGLPLYAEGLSLLREAASVLRSTDMSPRFQVAIRTIERLAASSAWAGSAFSFYGANPGEPSPERQRGMPPPNPAGPRMRVEVRGSFSFMVLVSDEEAPESGSSVGPTDVFYMRDIGNWPPPDSNVEPRDLTSADELSEVVLAGAGV